MQSENFSEIFKSISPVKSIDDIVVVVSAHSNDIMFKNMKTGKKFLWKVVRDIELPEPIKLSELLKDVL